jgi:glyoxylase-like metal-dependent hydrolase (beta-lactamase superfamily II)
MGIMSLVEAARDLLDKKITAVATHGHADHVGGHHEFDETIAHRLEADWLANPRSEHHLVRTGRDAHGRSEFKVAQYDVDEAGDGAALCRLMSPTTSQTGAQCAWVEEGTIVDLALAFRNSPSPGPLAGRAGPEAKSGTLFSGDTIYDGVLIDDFEHSDIPTYVRTIERLREMPVTIVHAGHRPSFGRERLVAMCDSYLAQRRA